MLSNRLRRPLHSFFIRQKNASHDDGSQSPPAWIFFRITYMCTAYAAAEIFCMLFSSISNVHVAKCKQIINHNHHARSILKIFFSAFAIYYPLHILVRCEMQSFSTAHIMHALIYREFEKLSFFMWRRNQPTYWLLRKAAKGAFRHSLFKNCL